MNEISQLKRQADEAIRQYEQEAKRLYRGGRTIFPQEEHRERIGELRSERNRSLRAIESTSKELFASLSRGEDASVSVEFAPDSVLTGSQRSEVRDRLPSVEADVAALRTADLMSRLEGILKTGSRVEQFCYLQVARRRDREDQERRASRAPGTPPVYRGAQVSPLQHILTALDQDVLGPERERRRAEISSREAALNDLIDTCYLGRNDSSDPIGAQRYAAPIGGPSSGMIAGNSRSRG
jgi:hypothetical protein